MSSLGIGDLLTGYSGALNNSRLKNEIQQLTQELSSGQRTNLKEAGGADLARFANLSTAVTTLKSYRSSAENAALLSETMQFTFGNMQDVASTVSTNLLTQSQLGVEPSLSLVASEARGSFESIIASLNTRVADRSLFAGQAIDGPAIAEADTILSDLTIAVAGATTAADVEVIVDAWFDTPGGGFETIGYLGAAEDLAPMALGLQEAADFALRADDQAVRDMLKSFAMASLVAEGAFASDITERAELLRSAGERMFTANDEFNALRANLGVVEAEIENALVRNTAETAALELAQAEIIAIDPFKSATDLAAAENQLEMLYAITARLSRLTLVDYLR